jgi:hypothetical protein
LAKNKPIAKPVVWLIIAVSLLLVPLLFAFAVVFPLGSASFAALVLIMHLLFAGALLFAFMKFRKVKSSPFYLIAVLAAVGAPVIYAYVSVLPLLTMVYSLTYLLMHVVFAAGFLVLYTQRGNLKKLF